MKKYLNKIYNYFGVPTDDSPKVGQTPKSKQVTKPKSQTKKTPAKPKQTQKTQDTQHKKTESKKKFFIFEKKAPKGTPSKKKFDDTTIKSVKQKPKASSKDDSTQRYLPFSEIRDNIMVMKDGSLRMVLRVDTVNFNLKSEQEQDSIIYSYQHFLNSLQFPIQILVRSLKVDIEGYIERLNTIATSQENQLLKEQTVRYIDFLNNLVDMSQIMKKEFYIIVPHDESKDSSVRSTGVFQFVTNFW